jgi:hypothetical protein
MAERKILAPIDLINFMEHVCESEVHPDSVMGALRRLGRWNKQDIFVRVDRGDRVPISAYEVANQKSRRIGEVLRRDHMTISLANYMYGWEWNDPTMPECILCETTTDPRRRTTDTRDKYLCKKCYLSGTYAAYQLY